jgi:dUTP pyrophosphatase
MTQILKYYKLHEDVKDPVFSTLDSACFDLHAFLRLDDRLDLYQDTTNKEKSKAVEVDGNGTFFRLHPWERAKIPIGIIFDIPKGYSVRIHPRSGLSYSKGVVTVNNVGIIDSDYVEPSFALMMNVSSIPHKIYNGDRIVQGELVEVSKVILTSTSKRPELKTDRDGGFGSTGT